MSTQGEPTGAPHRVLEPARGTAISFQPGQPLVKGINRKTLMALAAVVVLAIAFAVNDAFKKKPVQDAAEKDSSTPAPVPGDMVARMPASYDGIPKSIPKLGPPRPGEFGASEVANERRLQAQTDTPFGPQQKAALPQQSSEEREVERQRLERLKRAGQAREAGLVFGNASGASAMSVSASDDAMRQRMADLSRQQQGGVVPPSTFNPMASASGARDAENRQDDKSEFQARKRTADGFLRQAVTPAPSGPVIGAGAIIPAVFLTGINSDLPGQITGQVSQNVYDSATGRHLMIPQGAMLIGEYDAKVTYGQERVLLVWSRVRLPNGTSLTLEGMPGTDLSGYAGVTDQVNNHWMKLIGGVVFGSVIGATAQVAQGGSSVLNPSFAQLAVQGAGQNINQAGQEITRKNLGIQPTLEIRPGMRFNVFVTKDVAMPVYEP